MINNPKTGQKVLYINAPVPFGSITDKPPAAPIYHLALGAIKAESTKMPTWAVFKPEVYLHIPHGAPIIASQPMKVLKAQLFAIGDNNVFKLIFRNGFFKS